MKQGNATSRKNKIANKNAASKGQQALKALATSGKTFRKTSSGSSFLSNILLVVLFAIFLLVSMLSNETETPSTKTVRGSVPRTPATRVDDTLFANVKSSYSAQIVDSDDNDDGPSETNEKEEEDSPEKDSPEKKMKDMPVEISNNTFVSPTNSTLNDTNIEEKKKKQKKDPLEGWIYEPKNVNYFW